MKIRNKLAYLFTGMVAAVLLLFSLGTYYMTSRYRENEFYERLREKAVTTARLLYETREPVTPETLRLIDDQDRALLTDEHITVYDQRRRVVYDNTPAPHPLPEEVRRQLARRPETEIRRRLGQAEYLYKTHREPGQQLFVVVSAVDRHGLDNIRFLAGVLVFGWVACLGLSTAIGFFFAGKALQPIADVVGQVEQIDSETLDTRRVRAGNERDEIAQLAQTFNHMLDRLHESFGMQRSFVANASHELRTPLTAMKGQIEVALMHARTPAHYRQLLLSLADDIRNMTDLTNALLDMAQASSDAAGLPLRRRRVDELVLQAEAELLKKKPHYTIVVDFVDPPDEESLYELPVEERLLKNAFLNLMENACKFSADHRVQVLLAFRAEAIVVDFSDTGVGIAPADLEHVFEPFFRAGNGRHAAGHGIGLPLVQRIVQLHRGAVRVASQVGAGSTFTVVLPR